jgi:hypothetical protein
MYTSHQLFDAFVNGEIFHSDETHLATIENLGHEYRWHAIWLIRSEIVVPIFNAAAYLTELIGYLKLAEKSDYVSLVRKRKAKPYRPKVVTARQAEKIRKQRLQ